MITWLAPLALALLAVLPILWWLHRREPKPTVVVVPSLIFLEAEPPTAERLERRRLDGDLLLALTAAALLALAGAGPVLGGTTAGRRIAVLIDASPAMEARSIDGTTASDRASAAVNAIRRLTADGDRFESTLASGDELARRLRDTSSGTRILVGDRRPRDLPVGVSFVGVGDPAAVNAGIVSIDLDVVAGRRRVSATIWNDAATRRSLRAGPEGAETEVDCPAFGAARASWDLGPIPASGEAKSTLVRLIDERGALDSDDLVVLDPGPLRVAFAPGAVSAAVEAATRRALDAILVGGWREDATAKGGLFVGPARDAPDGASLVLEIGRVPAGIEPIRPGEQDVVLEVERGLGRDLELAGAEWLYPPSPDAHAPWPRITSSAEPSRRFPGRFIRWHADPALGRPAAIDTPLWPLFIENVVRSAPGTAGQRWSGVLDRDVTRLGRDVAPVDESAVAAAPRDVIVRRNALGPWFGVGGAICLAVLWCRPRNAGASSVR